MEDRMNNRRNFNNNTPVTYGPRYRQIQFLESTDTRTQEERIKTLPCIRDEDLEEWRYWAENQ